MFIHCVQRSDGQGGRSRLSLTHIERGCVQLGNHWYRGGALAREQPAPTDAADRLTAMTPVELASMSVSCVNLQHGEKCHKPYRRWWQRENAPEIGKASYLGKFNLISSFQRRTQFQSWPDQIQNAPPVNLYNVYVSVQCTCKIMENIGPQGL